MGKCLTFRERSFKVVGEYCMKINTILTEEEVNLLRSLLETEFENQHWSTTRQLGEVVKEQQNG